MKVKLNGKIWLILFPMLALLLYAATATGTALPKPIIVTPFGSEWPEEIPELGEVPWYEKVVPGSDKIWQELQRYPSPGKKLPGRCDTGRDMILTLLQDLQQEQPDLFTDIEFAPVAVGKLKDGRFVAGHVGVALGKKPFVLEREKIIAIHYDFWADGFTGKWELAWGKQWGRFYGPIVQIWREQGAGICPAPRTEKRHTVRASASYDPNEKVGLTGYGPERYLSGEQPLIYTIFFENLETAGLPAQEVVIKDQLDTSNLDLATFSLGTISFGERNINIIPGTTSFSKTIDLRHQKNLLVRIEAGIDTTTGLVRWYFKSIDPDTGQLPEDPEAGFLPPNKNPPEGQGSVTFTVMPKEGLATDTGITNMATIVFDVNPPIETNVWVNTVDNVAPQSQVLPLAATQRSTSFVVEWSGNDPGSSGIKDFTIYVSEDGRSYTVWLPFTTSTSETFTGEAGKTYRFYSVARDNVGNIEDPPDVPDATTTITEAGVPGDLDGDGDVDRNDLNILLTYRNKPASNCPECDLDGDGMITVLDARKLVLLCTRPRCATK